MFKRPGCLLLLLLPIFILAGLLALFLFRGTRSVSGVVVDGETGAPIAGAAVSAEGQSAETNERGEYNLALPRAIGALSASADGYATVQQHVENSNGLAGPAALDFKLAPNRLTGIVQDAESKERLAQVAVQVGGAVVTADAQGEFVVRAIKKQTPVQVNAPGYQAFALVFADETQIVLALTPVTVQVTATNAAGRPLPNTQVQTGAQTVPADAEGRAVLRRIPQGAIVSVSAPGHATASAPYNGNDLHFILRPNSLDGTITDAVTGKPISGTLVYLGATVVAANAQGVYHLENAPANAMLTFKAAGYAKTQVEAGVNARRDVKLAPFVVKGIHLPFAMEPERVRAAMDLIGKTELNALVLDIKAEKGLVGWDSKVPLARQINAPYLKGIGLGEVIDRCRAQKIYCIARIPVFQDSRLAAARPDLALKFPGGKPFTESGERGWTDPSNQAVWDYNIALAKEAAALGFDEVQFDYIRFPGHIDGLYAGATATEEGRIAAITGFLARAQKELRPTGVFVSADVFGLTVASSDEQHTGQRLKDLGPYLDYLSPMVYPAVWAEASILLSKGLGIPNCAVAVNCPYEVIFNSYKRATEKTTAKVRLWLQGYAGRGDYGVAEYRLQKKAAEDTGGPGWMFWNATGNYDPKMFGPR